MPSTTGQMSVKMSGEDGVDTRQALRDLGVTDDSLTAEQRRKLDEDGFFVIEDAFSADACRRMQSEVDRIVADEGERAGSEVSIERGATRVSNVFNKTEAFDLLLRNTAVLAAAHHVLGAFKIHGANVREPQFGQGKQPLHSDSVKLPDGRWCLTNALILLDDMTLDNGPTRIVPGSHKWAPLNVPGENAMGMGMGRREKPHEWAKEGDNVLEYVAASPVTGDADKAPADPFAPYPGEVMVTVPACAIVFCNAHMWHSGTTKNVDVRRRQLHLSHTRRDMDQQLNQRAYLTPALYGRMDPALRYILDIH
jgi:ectoine hydroxylase-related dioxygenase (phytanoyl-CoA dioxygenase family)